MLAQALNHLHHLFMVQALNSSLYHIPNIGFVHRNKALIIHEGKETHDELAIHTICDSTMARDGFAKVFDFECAFETAGKEAAKGCDEGGEGCEDEDVELHGSDMDD